MVRLSGRVSADDLVASIHAFRRHPAYAAGMRLILDWREIQQLVVDLPDVSRIRAALVAVLQGQHGRAAIVTPHEIHASLAELLRVRARGLPLRVFSDLDAAVRWAQVDVMALGA